MLKTRKKGKTVKLGKFSRKNLPEISQIPGIPTIFRDPREFIRKFTVFREVENSGKRKTLLARFLLQESCQKKWLLV